MPQRLQLPSRTVEGAVPTETVVDQDLRGQAVREDAREWYRSAQLVTRGLIPLIPAPIEEIEITAGFLGGQRESRDEDDNNEDVVSPRPQSRYAPRKCFRPLLRAAPCDAR